MKRPTIDKTAHYKKVRPSELRSHDAITFDSPQPGCSYYRVTDKSRRLGYFVGTKKAEDTGRPSKPIPFHGQRAFLIERPMTAQDRQGAAKRDEKVTPRPKGRKPAETPATPDLKPGDVMAQEVIRGGRVNLTVIRPGKPILQARDDHRNWKKIKDALASGETDKLDDLFVVPKSIEITFKRLSDRVTLRNGRIHLDNDPADNALTKLLLRFIDEDRLDDLAPLVAFYENVQQNPSDNSRQQLFAFLDNNDMTITQDGLIIAYKGVVRSTTDKNKFTSCHAGPAIVDGKNVSGNVPNNPGSLIEMPRSQVVDKRNVHCSVGLHVGAYQYAAVSRPMGGNATLEVHVHPRDVVSVPNDYNAQKVRCCRYRVVGEVSKPVEGALKL